MTGATGFIGTKLCKYLTDSGYDVVSFSRNAEKSKQLLPEIHSHLSWHLDSDDWYQYINGAKAVINLAGKGIADSRWTNKHKQEVIESRVKTTSAIVQAIKVAESKPVLINASAIGFYGDRGNEVLNEKSERGTGFLADVTSLWENEADKASEYTNVVKARIGIVLGKDGGALPKMIIPFKFYIGGALGGGTLGNGRQYMSWIHINDILRLFKYIIEHPEISGVVNFVSPNPVTMNEFAKVLGKVLHRFSIFNVPDFILKLIMGESAEMVISSALVSSELESIKNFKFEFPNLNSALTDLLK